MSEAYRDRQVKFYPLMVFEIINIATMSLLSGASAVAAGVAACFATLEPVLWIGVAMLGGLSIGSAWSASATFNLARDETIFHKEAEENLAEATDEAPNQ